MKVQTLPFVLACSTVSAFQSPLPTPSSNSALSMKNESNEISRRNLFTIASSIAVSGSLVQSAIATDAKNALPDMVGTPKPKSLGGLPKKIRMVGNTLVRFFSIKIFTSLMRTLIFYFVIG